MIKKVDTDLENYRITESARSIQAFADELSNWYVRRCRERFWQKDMPQDKINAYMTLYTVLYELCKLCAPYVPFMTEEIYQNLVRTNDTSAPESIHFCDFPAYNADFVDEKLEANMELVLKLVVAGRAARNTANSKNRQPLAKMYAQAPTALDTEYFDIVLEELNVKELEFVDSVDALVAYKFKPQLRTLGPKYGKILGKISAFLATCDTAAAMEKLNADDLFTFEIDGAPVALSKEDLLIETVQKEGLYSETDRDVTVILDTNLTPELVEEGFVREIISKIQTMRKEADFDVQNHIKLFAEGSDKVVEIIANNKEEIMAETLCDGIEACTGYTKDWNINGEAVTIIIDRI